MGLYLVALDTFSLCWDVWRWGIEAIQASTYGPDKSTLDRLRLVASTHFPPGVSFRGILWPALLGLLVLMDRHRVSLNSATVPRTTFTRVLHICSYSIKEISSGFML